MGAFARLEKVPGDTLHHHMPEQMAPEPLGCGKA